MSILFSKETNFKKEHEFIKEKLNDGFIIKKGEKSKVIFGFNGSGKTTIFRTIKSIDDTLVEFIEYENSKVQFKGQKKSININYNIASIYEIKDNIENKKQSINLKKSMNDIFGITSIKKAKSVGARVSQAREGEIPYLVTSKEEIKKVSQLIAVENLNPFIIDNMEQLQDITELKTEIENNKNKVLYDALKLIDEVIVEEDIICPVCDQEKHNLKTHILKKLELLNRKTDSIINKLKTSNISLEEYQIENMLEAVDLLKDKDLYQDYVLCGGKAERYEEITSKTEEITTLEAQLKTLETEAKQGYLNLKNKEKEIISDMKKYFGVEENSITFDDSNNKITIKLPREIETYSTGEINLLMFLIGMYGFLGSDRTTLILDDPVSSLDLVYHYKIAFELVKMAENKELIILTHSIELINTLNSQYSNKFDFYYIEETNELLLQKIELNSNSKNPNIITLSKLVSKDDTNFIKALIQKEEANHNDEIHKLFHYTPEIYKQDGYSFSNNDLCNEIERFTEFENVDFTTNSIKKIRLLTALRVWVESKLYGTIPASRDDLRNIFLNKASLFEKIGVIFPRDKSKVEGINIPRNLTRDALMSKRVMLNQNTHYQSQVMPFAYAISLSIADLTKEIKDIKNLFME